MFAATFGALLAGPISDKFGRKWVIILSDVLFAAGSFVLYFASSISMLIMGRLIIGLGLGVTSLVGPVYVSETAPVELRGTLVSVYITI